MKKLLFAAAIVIGGLLAGQPSSATLTPETAKLESLYQKKAKTVRVKSYRTKSGKTVHSHKRSKPSKKH